MKRLGDILLEAGILDPSQLDFALHQERRSGERLGALMVRMGLITEELLVKALARQFRLPVLDLINLNIPEHLLTLLPKEILFENCILPVAVKGIAGKENLIIATADPTKLDILTKLESHLPYTLRPGLSTERAIKNALERYYSTLVGVKSSSTLYSSFLTNEQETTTSRLENPVFASVEEITNSISSKIPNPSIQQESELTKLTKKPATFEEEDSDIIRTLTEPTHPGFRLPPVQKQGSIPSGFSPINDLEIKRMVQKTNKEELLIALIKVLIDRKIVSLEEIMAWLEIKK